MAASRIGIANVRVCFISSITKSTIQTSVLLLASTLFIILALAFSHNGIHVFISGILRSGVYRHEVAKLDHSLCGKNVLCGYFANCEI